MTLRHTARIVALMIACALVASISSAQDAAAPRDPLALAQRYLGYTRDLAFPPPTPIYEVGATETFWVPRRDADAPQQAEFTLVGAANGAYVWAEDGVTINGSAERSDEDTEEAMTALAQSYGALFNYLRLRSNFGDPGVPLAEGESPLAEDLLPVPDVDNNPQWFILYTRDLPDERTAFYNPTDSLPEDYVLDERTNQRETIVVNTAFFTSAPIDDGVYRAAVTRAFLEMVAQYNFPEQADWLQTTMIELTLQALQEQNPPINDMAAFFDSPDTSLLAAQEFATRQRVNGAQQLFLNYYFQRYGNNAVAALFGAPGAGMGGVDSALAETETLDPLTSEPVTARAAFADFVLANALNFTFGDGRYRHTVIPIREGAGARVTPLEQLGDVTITNRNVPQFGAYYLLLNNTTEAPAQLSLSFAGRATTPRLPMPADRAAEDAFYWSGTAQDANPTMTRALDLRVATAATLTFDAWYAQPEGVDYAYVSVSTDDGATWQIVPTTDATTANPLGAAYGPGLTGYSNPDGARPFPILGIVMEGDGQTIGSVVPDGPAGRAGVQAGDILIGYDGQEWERIPNIIAALLDYAPGETITLMIGRGEGQAPEVLDIPVVLDAHPTRTLPPDALWLSQTADLSAFAGSEVLLRFEVVTLPNYPTLGFAVDNLEIAEINFADGGDAADEWTLDGFAAVTNAVPQQFLVQAFVGPTQTDAPAVTALIGVGDAATDGVWEYTLVPSQQLLIAVSGLNDDTQEDATFTIGVDVAE
jgi:hypothetical protein